MKRFALSDLPSKYQEQVVGQLGVAPYVVRPPDAPPAQSKPPRTHANDSGGVQVAPKKRLRQDSKGMNKTEEEFYNWAKERGWTIFPQAITLKLANGVRYTPDFVTVACHSPTFYETKGFMRDDASVKIKVAASLYPFWTFYLVSKLPKKKGGGWDIQKVLP